MKKLPTGSKQKTVSGAYVGIFQGGVVLNVNF